MTRKTISITSALLLTLTIAGCGDKAGQTNSTESSTQVATTQKQALPANIQKVIDALDKLKISHSDPMKGQPNLSEATEVWDLKINNYDAGISSFQNPEGLNLWQEASDNLGGISVTFDNTAISLNSDEGRQDSVEIAPKLAKELNGTAHGVNNESDKLQPSQEQIKSEPNQEPYVVECIPGTPGPSRMSDGTTKYTDYCGNQPGAAEAREAEANAGLPESNTPGCDGPAAICGYGTDASGNPNPTSGELQLMDGCQQGYIDDPERCAAVMEDANRYGW